LCSLRVPYYIKLTSVILLLERVANLMRAKGNSTSYPQQNGTKADLDDFDSTMSIANLPLSVTVKCVKFDVKL